MASEKRMGINNLQLQLSPLNQWIRNYKKPLIIAELCGAETEMQLITTAREISKNKNVSIFRAGIWKPRTRPNSFEGVGIIGLEWLKTVKEETGMLTAVEVANAQHVEQALKHGIDVLWIGARTTVNPFSVQEIADTLKGTNIPVMIKNPVNPDIKLWIGALERLNQAGITKLIAIHRGFFSFEKSKYRNAPNWNIPIELKMLCPDLPIVCDPSHISGTTKFLEQTMQKAIDLAMDGLMIETHINPEEAWSDAEQQVTPLKLNELLEKLIYRKATTESFEFQNKLQQLRKLIDGIDDDLLDLLAKRMAIVEKIGEYKKLNNVTILQLERWFEILGTRTTRAELLELNKEFIKDILQLLHKESIRKQTEVMNSTKMEK